ncbi:MAG: PD-(D/E)XK nuclease family protein [Candidatus Peregrinibacteria bacterium]
MALSYSQLRLYRVCPRQYEYAVIRKLPKGISVEESFGSSVHNALKKWGELEPSAVSLQPLAFSRQQELFSGEPVVNSVPLTEEKLLEIWHQSFIFNTYPTRLEADFARRRGEDLMRHFFQWWSSVPRRVVAVEKAFSLSVDGMTVTGRLDRVEEADDGIRIIDFKTSAPREQQDVDADLQLSLYALAAAELFAVPCHSLSLLFLSEEGAEERVTARNASQCIDARKHIHAIAERITAKDFRPTPSLTICRRCPYRGVCDVAAA